MTTLSGDTKAAGDQPVEPMTDAQRHYLDSLCREAREPLPTDLSVDEADALIAQLQRRTGRGLGG